MNETKETYHSLKPVNYELFILGISATLLINLVLTWMLATDEIVDSVIRAFSLGMSMILLGDFIYRIRTAPSARGFFFPGGGWMDLLGCIPMTPFALFRLYRMVWTVRQFNGLGERELRDEISTFRAGGAFYLIIFLGIVLLEFASASIVGVEGTDPAANITTAGDAIWWAYVTITTVGYGDYYPVTSAGRVIGVLVMTIGVALFTGLTGFLANSFFSDRERAAARLESRLEHEKSTQLAAVVQVQEFRRLLHEQQQANAKLQAKLADIEAFLEAHGDPSDSDSQTA